MSVSTAIAESFPVKFLAPKGDWVVRNVGTAAEDAANAGADPSEES